MLENKTRRMTYARNCNDARINKINDNKIYKNDMNYNKGEYSGRDRNDKVGIRENRFSGDGVCDYKSGVINYNRSLKTNVMI